VAPLNDSGRYPSEASSCWSRVVDPGGTVQAPSVAAPLAVPPTSLTPAGRLTVTCAPSPYP